jgi:uncharacterized protein (TIGR04255 family)
VLNLPEPDRSRLPGSPLDVVVCQVRFDAQIAVSEPRFGLEFHTRLGGRDGQYPKLSPVESQALSVAVGPGAAPQVAHAPAPSGWQLSAGDGSWSVSLAPEALAVETRSYEDWSGFRERFAAALEAVTELCSPQIEQRLGLRYVDRISEAGVTDPIAWVPLLDERLLGVIAHPVLGEAVRGHQQQVVLDLGEDALCRFVHGLLPADHEQHYVLDYDLHREGARPFDRDGIMQVLDAFNTDALKLFQASVTEELVQRFQEVTA